jgi:hypothetical protein
VMRPGSEYLIGMFPWLNECRLVTRVTRNPLTSFLFYTYKCPVADEV